MEIVALPKMLRLIGNEDIPEHITAGGYNPHTDEQVCIFGSERDLSIWRDDLGLDPLHYPIHDSSLGIHIDVYGQNIGDLFPNKSLIRTFRQFMLNRRIQAS